MQNRSQESLILDFGFWILDCFCQIQSKRMFEKSLMVYQIFIDPPKSPLEMGTLTLVPPFLRGVRGDQGGA